MHMEKAGKCNTPEPTHSGTVSDRYGICHGMAFEINSEAHKWNAVRLNRVELSALIPDLIEGRYRAVLAIATTELHTHNTTFVEKPSNNNCIAESWNTIIHGSGGNCVVSCCGNNNSGRQGKGSK
jgi:hypothetical protein